MALRKLRNKPKQPPPEQLSIFHSSGRSWSRSLEAGTLQRLLQSTLAHGGVSAQVSWEQVGQLGTALLIQEWPDFLAPPLAVFLRRSSRKPFGLELTVDLDGRFEVQEYGEDLRRYLVGEQRLEEVQPVAETAPPVAVPPNPSASVAPKPASAPRSSQPLQPSTSGRAAPTSESKEEEPPGVQVIAPGERIHQATRRTWSQSESDVFGLAGEVHPDDEVNHGLEISTADLPWLNPGDAIISPRRGPCRIKRVEDEAQQVIAKDENNQLIALTFRELLAEFQFDDGN